MKYLLLFLLFLLEFVCFAQVRCLTDNVISYKNRSKEIEKFQDWITAKKLDKANKQLNISNDVKSSSQEVLKIPVVFHILHNGEIIGQGRNVATAKVEDQLRILNEDFARTNVDRVNTVAEFQSVAANVGIEFVFAKQDPNGLPTNGIVRVRASKSSFSTGRPGDADDVLLKSDSHWPSEDYLNIYCVDLSTGLGYAQFPFSNLDGLESEFFNYGLTDGVVVDYKWFGINLETGGSFQSYGRTLTHEVGHYFGLLHIWGLNFSCNNDDYCEDTPLQSNSTSGCNLNTVSCGNVNMVQNYMDYSDDVCMNAFTSDQKDRMRIVAQDGHRRKSLLSSPALVEPQLFNQDLGIVPVVNAPPILCSEDFMPEIMLINYGLDDLENYSVSLYVNDALQEEVSASSTLNSLATKTLRFREISLNLNQENTFRYVLAGTDENPDNNEIIKAYPNSQSSLLPFEEDFEDGNNSLIRENESIWEVSNAPDSTAMNNALKIEYFNTDLPFGQMDYLVTELLDVSALTSAELSFSYAYSGRSSDVFNDGLIVGIIPSCENTLTINNIVFERYGRRLVSTTSQETAYTPFGPSEWERSSLNITPYLGEGLIQIVFIGVNGGGNNIYLDNIAVTSAELERLDLGVRKIEGITPTTCQKEVFPIIEFKNFGYEDIESLDLDIMINERIFKQNYQNIDIFSGFSESFSLSIRSLTFGENDISIKIDKINGEVDTKSNNNIISFKVVVDESEEIIPVRETFDQPKWTINFTEDSPAVTFTEIDNSEVIKFNAFESTYVGGSSYVSSPILKTNNQREGAIRIKYSYASRNGFTDKLKVLLSNNCGRTYEIEVFNQDSEDLAIRKSEEEWVPESDADWGDIFIDVSEHLVWDELRVLVEFQNGGGNNLYIDDIEFLTNNDPDQLFFENRLTVFPNPAIDEFYVNVNMPLKETLHIQLIDMAGKVIFDQNFPNSLNQTYRMIAPSQSGFYLLKVNGNQIKQTKRLYIRP